MSGESEAMVSDSESNQPLKSLGKYLIERKLGQGGMGTVYLARHADLKKLVALKVLPRDKAKNPTLVRRFKAEAQAAAHLEHPNIVAVYDTGEADGYLYITMEFVDGIDLFEYLKRRKTVAVKRSIEFITQAASALQHAFEQNIVHRDIKPSNLLLRRDGTIKLTDLGLARSIDETLETNITRAGTTVGTVDYMAPEQARNSKLADIRSDIYSLGCTWYQMLTGQPPYPDGGMMNKLAAHSIKPLPDPRELNENVPEGIFAILQRMTAKKPEDRYQTPAELLEDINRSMLTKAAISHEILTALNDDEPTPIAAPVEENVETDDEPDDHVGSHDVTETLPTRRSRHVRDEEDGNETSRETSRRRPRSVDDDTESGGTTKPLKSRPKKPSKPRDEDEPDETPTKLSRSAFANSSSKSSSSSSSPSPRRDEKREEKEKSSSAPSNKTTSSNILDQQKLLRRGSNPLPPKRNPTDEEPQPSVALDFDTIKRVGFVIGAIAIIAGLGGLIFQWGTTFDSVERGTKKANQTTNPEPVQPAPPVQVPDANESTAKNTPERNTPGFDIAKQPLPPWTTPELPLPTKGLTTYLVGPGLNSTNQFSDINEALQAVGAKGGGILRLQGDGPFVLSSVELPNLKKLVITAARTEDQPLIILKPSEAGLTTGLVVLNGELDLRGLHFVLDQSSNSPTTPNSIISVMDGQLYIRNCSFTAMNDGGADTSAIVFASPQDWSVTPVLDPNILLDRVTIRGNGLAGLRVHRSLANVVIQDSLFVTGTAPAIEITGQLPSGATDSTQETPRRIIRVLRTTMCCREHLLDFAAENSPQPPSTAILFQDSICSAEGTGNDAILASVVRWPNIPSNPGGWLINLDWTSVSSLYLGFDQLLTPLTSYKVNDADSWQRVWAKKFEPVQFQKLRWPDSSISDLSSVQPSDFDNAKLPFREVKTKKGNLPGCMVKQLKVPRVISQSRLQLMSHRPAIPSAITRPLDVSKAKKIDLSVDDLSQVLNRPDWPSGTVFEAVGFGVRTMSPVKISGKSVQIVFRQMEGAALLRIRSKNSDSKTKSENTENTALFTIENGVLELQSINLEASPIRSVAPWLINAQNSTVILRGCQLSGPQQHDVEQYPGLIQWTTTTSSSVEQPFLSINDSLLMSTGIGIRAECAQGNVFLRNSILAVRGYGISLLPIRSDNALVPSFDLNHVTFSTSKAAFRIEAPRESGSAISLARMYVDNSVVLAPIEFKPGEAEHSAVMEFAGAARDQKQIEWLGNSFGIADEIHTFIRRPSSDPVTSTAGWHSAWNESSAIRLLTGPNGVQLVKPLPNKWTNLKAASFALEPGSQSATFADGASPLGADVRIVEEATTPKKVPKDSKTGTSTTKKTPANKPGTNEF